MGRQRRDQARTAPPPQAATGPPPAAVRGNDWRSLAVAPMEDFEPALTATVVIPHYEAPEALALTLAGLEGQTYPRGLFDVVVVDDGSDPPLELEELSPLALRVIHQQDLGFGAARARNNGARAAAGRILAFLDCDMVPEAGWLACHARWHHAAGDLVTLGFRRHVDAAGIAADDVRGRPGTLADLFDGRPVQLPEWIERRMSLTDDLASDADDVFRVVTGGNFAVSAEFFWAAGGFDESFTQWGAEDVEFGWRAYSLGALLVPERGALCWHQGEGAVLSETEWESLEQQHDKLSHLIPDRRLRSPTPGRSYSVPQFVVSVEPGPADQQEVLTTVEQVLAGGVHDLVVWVEERPAERFDRLRRLLDADPRVSVGAAGGAPAAWPAAAFHVRVPAGAAVRPRMLERLRNQLGPAASGESDLASGHRVSITRAWAVHRARRSGRALAELGSVVELDVDALRVTQEAKPESWLASRLHGPAKRVLRMWVRLRRHASTLLGSLARVRRPADAGRLAAMVARALGWRAKRLGYLLWRIRRVPARLRSARRRVRKGIKVWLGLQPRSQRYVQRLARYPLGAEIAAAGRGASAVFAASARVSYRTGDTHIDILLVDSPRIARAALGSPTEPGTATGTEPDSRANTATGTKPSGRPSTAAGTEPDSRPSTAAGTPPDIRPGTATGTKPSGRANTTAGTAPSGRAGGGSPKVAVLSELHPRLGVPAFNPEAVNPAGWSAQCRPDSAPLDSLVSTATCASLGMHLGGELLAELRSLHHVSDRAAHHRSPARRAGALAALAASGVLVHIEDPDPGLAELLGPDLHALMSSDEVLNADDHRREQISIAMRRCALRDHSLRGRARALLSTADMAAPRPEVSILAPTRRPDRLKAVIAAAARQTYPRLELVLALHGDGFGSDREIAALAANQSKHDVHSSHDSHDDQTARRHSKDRLRHDGHSSHDSHEGRVGRRDHDGRGDHAVRDGRVGRRDHDGRGDHAVRDGRVGHKDHDGRGRRWPALRIVRADGALSLGAVLNAAATAAGGSLITKMDDDDHYGAEHVWDLLLAHEYSTAQLVGKSAEYVHLKRIAKTVRDRQRQKFSERHIPFVGVSGGVLMISRHDLEEAGGWRRVPRRVDIALAQDVVAAGGRIYWTHGAGYMRVRHGDEHTWTVDDSHFLGRASEVRDGCDLAFAGITQPRGLKHATPPRPNLRQDR